MPGRDAAGRPAKQAIRPTEAPVAAVNAAGRTAPAALGRTARASVGRAARATVEQTARAAMDPTAQATEGRTFRAAVEPAARTAVGWRPGPPWTVPPWTVPPSAAPPREVVRTVAQQPGRSCGRQPCLAARSYTLTHPLHTFRQRSRTHAWAKPCLAGRPTALVRLQRCEKNTSRSRPSGMELPDYPVMALTPSRRTRMGPHLHFPPGLFPKNRQLVLLAIAWAKPCLAGRPTALVRLQRCEKNTSRSRPSGMELPDYPVMALTPTPWDQDGPALLLPARSFFKFVPRYASRRVFAQIRSPL
jgi:hypothetical protein